MAKGKGRWVEVTYMVWLHSKGRWKMTLRKDYFGCNGIVRWLWRPAKRRVVRQRGKRGD